MSFKIETPFKNITKPQIIIIVVLSIAQIGMEIVTIRWKHLKNGQWSRHHHRNAIK